MNNISNYNTELNSSTATLGIATLMAWASLNFYLIYSKDYSHLPNTMITCSKEVFDSIVGIFPVMIGVASYTTTKMYMDFRFLDTSNSFMTMFYIMNGDTMFDTITGAHQVSVFYCMIWSYLWILFGVNIVMNVTVAMVANGYVLQKEFDSNKWLTERHIHDPDEKDDIDHLIGNAHTIP